MKLRPNVAELQKLVDDMFGGNKSDFATAIGVDRGQVSKVLKDGTHAGSLFFGGLLNFCEKKRLDFKMFVYYPSDVNKFNSSADMVNINIKNIKG
ncbi:MAG: hypothetical protein ACYC2T_06115 [Bacillota bacterium]